MPGTPSRELDTDAAAEQGVDGLAAADELLAALAAIRRAARRRSARPAELGALTSAQLELVRLLRRRPGLRVAEAAAELALASNTVSTLVRELSDAGIVERSVDRADRRVARLDLAPEIRRKVERRRDERVVAVAAALDGLPIAGRERLLEAIPLLTVLAEHLVQPSRA